MFTFKKFTAALKAKFSTNKTPTSSHRFPLVLSDGTPDGNATPADVMQLLGVPRTAGQIFGYERITSDANMDDLVVLPCYRCDSASVASTISGLPSDALNTAGFAVININPYGNSEHNGTQIIIQFRNIFIRTNTKIGNNWIWSDWVKLTGTQV